MLEYSSVIGVEDSDGGCGAWEGKWDSAIGAERSGGGGGAWEGKLDSAIGVEHSDGRGGGAWEGRYDSVIRAECGWGLDRGAVTWDPMAPPAGRMRLSRRSINVRSPGDILAPSIYYVIKLKRR